MPEFPEMEAWRRQLDDPVSAFPIAKAGPAHIATLKTYDPPLAALDGRRLEGVERRAKRLLMPTDDGDLVLLFHLMTAGRLKFLRAGEKGPKTPEHPVTMPGDFWYLGPHRLLCGDATVATDVDRLLDRVKPQLMVTDPPYGVDYDPAWRNKAAAWAL